MREIDIPTEVGSLAVGFFRGDTMLLDSDGFAYIYKADIARFKEYLRQEGYTEDEIKGFNLS